MNIIYSNKQIVNTFEGCAIGSFFDYDTVLVFYNKNIIKFYALNNEKRLIFLLEKYLLENILQIEVFKYNQTQDGLLIFFESTKISTCIFNNYMPIINSLKTFEKEEFDIRFEDLKFLRIFNNFGIAKISKRFFSLFSLTDPKFLSQVWKFSDIKENMQNIIDFIFITSYYEPTLCIVYNPIIKPYTKHNFNNAVICYFDFSSCTFKIIEEFTLPCYTRQVFFSNDVLAFVSDNDIFFRNFTSSFILTLNKMSLNANNENLHMITLKHQKCFFYKNDLIIFNGNGDVYKVIVTINSKKIVNASIVIHKNFIIPRFLYNYSNFLFVCSNEKSILFEIKLVQEMVENKENIFYNKKIKTEIKDYDKKIKEEYERIFNTSLDYQFINTMILHKIAHFDCIGYINDFYENDLQILAVSEGIKNYILEISNILKFEYIEEFSINDFTKYISKKFNNIYDKEIIYKLQNSIYFSEDDNIFIIIENKCINCFKENSLIYSKNFDYEIENASCVIINEKLNIFTLHKSIFNCIIYPDEIFTEFKDVFCYTANKKFLIIYTSKGLLILNSQTLNILYRIQNFGNLNDIYQFKEQSLKGNEIKINTLFIFSSNNFDFLFVINEYGKFAIYNINKEYVCKIYIDKHIQFDPNTNKKIISVKNLFYLNSIEPYFLYLDEKNEFFFYNVDRLIDEIYSINDLLIFKIQDNFCISKNIFYNYYNQEVPKKYNIKNSNDIDHKVNSSKIFNNLDTEEKKYIFDKHIIKKIKLKKIPKNLETIKNYILISSCEKVPFKKTEDDNISVYTYKFSIDLFTKDYKYISSFNLEEDEYVFDIRKLTLNDNLGVSGKSDFIVLCITKIEGEDKHSRGRIVVLELIDIITDKNSRYKDKKLKLIASENIKGCIVKCDEIQGNIVVCLGIKTMVYKVNRSEGLIPIGIHDLNTLTTSLMSIKNFLLTCDINRGLSFFYYQKKPIRLNLLCTSDPIKDAMHVSFLLKNTSLAMACFDARGNLHLYTYSPQNILSNNGMKFVKRCQTNFNPGKLVMQKNVNEYNKLKLCSDNNFLIEIECIDDQKYYNLLEIQNNNLFNYEFKMGLNEENFIELDYHLKPLSLRKPIVKEIIYFSNNRN